MRVVLAAIGRLKDGPDRLLFENYTERFDQVGRQNALGPITIHELPESRAQTASLRKDDEAARLLKLMDGADVLIALDERGKALTSTGFADTLRRARDDGTKTMVFAFGGPDGHGAKLKQRANLTLSLGPMTLPHGLARIVLTEQLYRTTTIIAGHPYHRI